MVESVKFLGVTLDHKLNGASHLRSLFVKGHKVANIVTSLSGVWCRAHPSFFPYIGLFIAVWLKYGAHILKLHRNRSLFLKVQRQQYYIIRSALGLRQSTPPPINILLAESCEPLLETRFTLLSSRYVFKCFARTHSLIGRSFWRLELESAYSSRQKRSQLLKSVPTFRPYVLQKYSLQSIRSVTPPLFSYNFSSLFPIPQYASFDILDSPLSGNDRNRSIPVAEIRKRFREFTLPLVNDGISLFMDGSKKNEDSAVDAVMYSPDLGLVLK